MRPRRIGALLASVSCLLSAGVSLADEAQRISNWAAPPFWSGPSAGGPDGQDPAPAKGRSDGGRHALAAGPLALPFIALPPCRLVDTRGNGAPLTGGFLPPATVRTYTLAGVCGVPANAQAISLNATAVHPTGPGFLVLYPEGGTFPPVSTLNYLGGDVIVNAAVVPLSVTGGISVALGVSGGDVLLDTNGYYAVADVESLNGLVGDVTLKAGSNITITPSANILTIDSSAGGVSSVAGTNGISASPATGAVTVTSNATSANTASTIVARDGTGSFSAGNITSTAGLNLPNTNAALTAGILRLGGFSFLHNFGNSNTFVGRGSGNGLLTGSFNAGVGYFTLISNTSGHDNGAFGANALESNTAGSNNSAFGSFALQGNSTGIDNSAFGVGALASNTTSENSAFGRAALAANTTGLSNSAFGWHALAANVTDNGNSAFGSGALMNSTALQNSAFGAQALTLTTTGAENSAFGAVALAANVTGFFNTAVGRTALSSSTGDGNTAVGARVMNGLTSGSNNLGIGVNAGHGLTSGSNNIYVGADLPAPGSESNVIRIGGTQTSTFVAGVFGQTSASGIAVFVNVSGKLGTTTSSRRYKEEIVDIAQESDVLMHLRPVAFVYRPEIDATRTPQYGLIAEEVAEVAPQLAVFDKDGRPETVRYHFVNAMLLNEVQKSRRMIDELRADRAELVKRLDALEQTLSRAVERRPN